MKPLQFGNIGVSVEGYTKESLYGLLEEHGLEELLNENYLTMPNPLPQTLYLQSNAVGPYAEDNTITISSGFIHYVIDMDNFLLILRTGILSPDAANGLVDELYSQGLIKPRDYNG